MMRRFGWALRRELWENRWLYLAPAALAATIVVGFAAYSIGLPARMAVVATIHSGGRSAPVVPIDVAAGLMMLGGLLIAAIYCIDAFYGERRDRSILFWKSLPVSDAETVLARICVPGLVVPVIIWVLTMGVHLLMLLGATAVLAARGTSPAFLWTELHPVAMSLGMLYHVVVVHGLFAAPLYAWLLLVSAWAPRAPFAWAVLPPLALGFLERVAFGTTHFAGLLFSRLAGGMNDGQSAVGESLMGEMAAQSPLHDLAMPGLWIGLVVAALFLAGTVRLRRSAQPA